MATLLVDLMVAGWIATKMMTETIGGGGGDRQSESAHETYCIFGRKILVRFSCGDSELPAINFIAFISFVLHRNRITCMSSAFPFRKNPNQNNVLLCDVHVLSRFHFVPLAEICVFFLSRKKKDRMKEWKTALRASITRFTPRSCFILLASDYPSKFGSVVSSFHTRAWLTRVALRSLRNESLTALENVIRWRQTS